MRPAALELLACPRCGGSLIATGDPASSDGHILTGELRSTCGARFAIAGGVPRLVAEHTGDLATTTARRFGREWAMFDKLEPFYEQQFLDWIAPLRPHDFAGKTVLEAGCGKGRHTQLVAGYGARAVVALDLGDAVDVAFRHTRHLAAVHVVQGDIARPPLARAFDLGFSIGVLHHLPEPRAGFRALCGRIRPGGRVAIWVYGRESNEWIIRYVDPVRRRLTARLPERLLYWATLPPSALLRAGLTLYRADRVAARLPYGAYLHYISRFPLREVHGIVFDQLVTPVAHYVAEDEVRSWFRELELAPTVAWHNRNSWRATAELPAAARPATVAG